MTQSRLYENETQFGLGEIETHFGMKLNFACNNDMRKNLKLQLYIQHFLLRHYKTTNHQILCLQRNMLSAQLQFLILLLAGYYVVGQY